MKNLSKSKDTSVCFLVSIIKKNLAIESITFFSRLSLKITIYILIITLIHGYNDGIIVMISIIEQTASGDKRNAAEIFLDEWSTMGKKRPTLKLLLELLEKAELFRAAEYVACDILKQEKPKRPKYGPAALVDTSDAAIKELLDKQMLPQDPFDNVVILESTSELISENNKYSPEKSANAQAEPEYPPEKSANAQAEPEYPPEKSANAQTEPDYAYNEEHPSGELPAILNNPK